MRKRILLLLILVGCLASKNNSFGEFKVIGYLPTWNGYPNSINNVDLTKVTHINIAFANPDANGNLTTSGGSPANLATVVTAVHNANKLVLMSIGGAGTPTGPNYTNLITNDLSGFVNKIVQYAVTNNLDGIDVDIEGDILNGSIMNSTQYENFIVALEVALHAQNKLMTAALGTWFSSRVTNTAASKFDFINLMSYDAYGTWTGPGQHSSYAFAVSDLNHWVNTKGVPASKLTVGVPFYGYFWGTGKYSTSYSNIVANYPGAENKDQVNPPSGGVLYHNGIPTIKQKTVLALTQAAGIMIWELTGDAAGPNSLLSAIQEVSLGYPTDIAPTVSITTPATSTIYTEGDTVEIQVNANDSDGSIMKVEYFAGTYKIGEQYGNPSTMKWSGAGPGSYSITVVVTDNLGASATSAAVSITVNAAAASLPFTGTAFNIPGKIEVENFNLGGNNVGYFDGTSTNLGGAYRTSRVDIEVCSDAGGGYNVGWSSAGEWMEYSVNIIANGSYDFQTRVASQYANKSFYISVDGINVTGTITVPTTGSFQTWQTVTASNIVLTQGLRKMRLVFNTADINVNYINTVVSSPTAVFSQLASEEKINTVYPNPMVEASVVRFHLKQPGQTKIELFDETGKRVQVLADQWMNAGENEWVLLKDELLKGIYFCRISGEQDMIGINVMIE